MFQVLLTKASACDGRVQFAEYRQKAKQTQVYHGK